MRALTAASCWQAQKRLTHLEMLSNTMLDTLANSGAEIDDTPFILKAQEACRHVQSPSKLRIDAGEIRLDDVFDRDYEIIDGTNPGPNMESRFRRRR